MTRHPMFGLLLAGFGVLVLTPDTLFMRLSVMDNFAMLAWRGLLMGATLLLCWLALGRGGLKADLRALCTAAGGTVMLCQFFNAILFSYGVATAPVSIVLFGTATVPVFAALFAYLIIGEPTRRATWLAIAAVLSGIGIAVFGGGDGMTALDLAVLQGALAGLGVAATLALSFVVIRSAPDLPILPAIGTG
ncbi:MAG: EamA family transporter, partial [Paracoccaceae bacterium]